MPMLELWNRLRDWLRRDRLSAELDEELRFHQQMLERDRRSQGLSDAEATIAARRRVGNRTAIAERTRAMWSVLWLDELLQDARYAWRGLLRRPGFAAITVLTLALGIGANSAIFSVVNAVLLRPLPYLRPDALVSVWGSTGAEFDRVRDHNHSFVQVGAWSYASVGISGVGEPEHLAAALVSADLFPTLGVAAGAGHAFAAGDDAPGATPTVVLSYGLWQRRYGGDPKVIGQPIVVEGLARTVIGVMPRDFYFPARTTQLWLPRVFDRGNLGAYWGSGGNHIVARLRAGITPDAARADVRAAAAELRHDNPVWHPGPEYGADAQVAPWQRQAVGGMRATLLVLLGVVSFVLLIACVNVANLLLVRAAARQRELAIRTALGGGRGRLLRQLLTESLVLALLGGTLGMMLAWAGVRFLGVYLPSDVTRLANVSLDAHVLAFTAAITIFTGLAFGLVPAVRGAGATFGAALRDSGRGSSAGAERHRLTSVLVSAEIALAVVLVIAAQLLVQSFWQLQHVDPGFHTEQVVSATVSPPERRYADQARLGNFFTAVLARARAIPGVDQAAAASMLPLTGEEYSIAIRIEGQFQDMRNTLPVTDHYVIITPGYLRAMGIPLLQGRDLSDADRGDAPPVVLVSQSLARHFWPGQEAVGKRIGYPWPSPWLTVAGVVGDVKQDSLSGTAEMTVYRPFAQAWTTRMTLVARTSGDPAPVMTALRAAVAVEDRDVPLSDIHTMTQVVAGSVAKPRFAMVLVAAFAGLALLLGVVGIYGVMSDAVTQRTREIGVRMALGATPRDALRLVVRQGVWCTVAGVGAGVVGALLATRGLAGLLYGVRATNVATFTAVPTVLAVISLLASYLPARRATRIDPMLALRGD